MPTSMSVKGHIMESMILNALFPFFEKLALTLFMNFFINNFNSLDYEYDTIF